MFMVYTKHKPMKALNLFGILAIGACTFQACHSPETRGGQGDSSMSDSGKTDTAGGAVPMGSGPAGDSSKTDNMAGKTGDVTNQSKVDDDEATFMKKAAIGGMMEVDAGKVAMKSTNPKVKAFAAQMVADHSKANAELKALAMKKEIILPAEYPSEEKAHMDMMKKMTGADFDKHYIDMMVTDHDKTIALFKTGAMAQDKEVKDFANKTIPVITGHFEKAKAIQAGMK
ncbi:putative membrane protein [Pedobacter westerhofensis]|uniref:Putative membrane protein n=2 Tax=Pedobacter westerhofensis TaxID=425512 RepID=A0A521EW94_9SPHI|nr:putative membrane protein [Pedobacter westerhofensis]